MAAAAAVFILPNLYMQKVLGFSAAKSGLGMLPQAFTATGMGAVFGYAFGRLSSLQNVLLGVVPFLVGLLLFALLPLIAPDGGYALLILLPLVLAAFGGPYSAMSFMANSTKVVSTQQQGIATSVLMTSQQIGLSLGVSLVLTIATSSEGPAVSTDRSLRYAYLAAFAVAVLGACFAFARRQGSSAADRADA